MPPVVDLIKQVGLGRALAMVVAEAERRGTGSALVLGALVDVFVNYTRHRLRLPVDEVVALVRMRYAGDRGFCPKRDGSLLCGLPAKHDGGCAFVRVAENG